MHTHTPMHTHQYTHTPMHTHQCTHTPMHTHQCTHTLTYTYDVFLCRTPRPTPSPPGNRICVTDIQLQMEATNMLHINVSCSSCMSKGSQTATKNTLNISIQNNTSHVDTRNNVEMYDTSDCTMCFAGVGVHVINIYVLHVYENMYKHCCREHTMLHMQYQCLCSMQCPPAVHKAS
jgi:hypothetical protein